MLETEAQLCYRFVPLLYESQFPFLHRPKPSQIRMQRSLHHRVFGLDRESETACMWAERKLSKVDYKLTLKADLQKYCFSVDHRINQYLANNY